MNPPTEKRRQWMWFVLLWCGGLCATLVFSYLFKWIIARI